MRSANDTFERLVCDYLDGSLPEAEREAFEKRLSRDPAALDLLCSQALLASSLQRLANSTRHLSHQDTEALWQHQSRRSLAVSLSMAVAIALITGIILYLIAAPRPPSTATIESAPHSHFSLSGNHAPDDSSNLRPGESIAISQGTVRLTLPDGSRCLAEAPASLTLHSLDHVILSGGLARFDIAKGSEGFKVTTRDIEIIDLGTAFGIDDRLDRQPQVHVFQGKIRATTRSGLRQSIILTAGQAAATGAAGKLRPVPADAGRFPSTLPGGLPALRLSFDPDTEGQLHATGSLARHAGVRISQPGDSPESPRLVPGCFGSAIRFDAEPQHLNTTWPGINGTLPRTISFWLKIDDNDDDSTGHILGWGLPSGKQSMSQFTLLYSGGKLANLRIASGRRWLQSSTRLDDGQWHHLAIVLDSYTRGTWPSVKFYLDGKPETLTPRQDQDGESAPLGSFATITHHPLSIPLTLGAFTQGSSIGSVSGSIDEVILAAGILDEPQIQALYQNQPENAGLALDAQDLKSSKSTSRK